MKGVSGKTIHIVKKRLPTQLIILITFDFIIITNVIYTRSLDDFLLPLPCSEEYQLISALPCSEEYQLISAYRLQE